MNVIDNTFRLFFQCDNHLYLEWDLFAFLLTKEKQIKGHDYLIYYNSKVRCNSVCNQLLQCENRKARMRERPCDPEMSVCGFSDAFLDDDYAFLDDDWDYDYCDIFLNRVPADVSEIIVVVSIHDDGRELTFDNSEMKLKLLKSRESYNNPFFEENFSQGFEKCTAIELIHFVREDDCWAFETVKKGYKGGIQELIEKYC
ncbi:MAG: TerD family protein [Bacteroidales bacterium]|nr:TerD family protein [Bacteroidales bacterium]